MRLFRWLMVLALLACALPLLSTLTAAGIAKVFKCTLHEGFANPCVIAGIDFGGVLTTMFVMGWLMLAALPLAVLLAAAWAIVEVVRLARLRSEAT